MSAPLRTDRLLIRPVALADAARVAEFTREPAVARAVAFLPDPQPLIAAEGFILIAMARAALQRDYEFAIDLPGEGLIGMVGVHPKSGQVEIGYWIGKPYWGAGYATEATRAAADFAESLNAGPIFARHFVDTPASGRVLSKAGFEYTGEIVSVYGLSRKARAPARVMVRPPRKALAA